MYAHPSLIFIYFISAHNCLYLSLQTSEVEIHFAVGESLADCSLGSESPSARNLWIDEDPSSVEASRGADDNMEEVLLLLCLTCIM